MYFKTSQSYIWALFLSASLFIWSVGCDEVAEQLEDTINGEVSPLKESELPNCSKVITCCDKLEELGYSDTIIETCNQQLKPAADFVIENYQSGRDALLDNAEGEDQEGAVNELKESTQGSFEPGCRCFLEETIGAVNSETVDLLPLDCEIDMSTGGLEDGGMCSDAISTLTSAGDD